MSARLVELGLDIQKWVDVDLNLLLRSHLELEELGFSCRAELKFMNSLNGGLCYRIKDLNVLAL